ncbi:hypothetical protein [Rhizobium leguminosarum]
MRTNIFWSGVAFLCGIGCAMSFVFLATLDQPTPTPWVTLRSFWGTYVYNFQTLITGVLAIAAAVATIVQMRLSDRNAAELQLDPVRKAVKRAIFPAIYELHIFIHHAQIVLEKIPENTALGWAMLSNISRYQWGHAERIHRILKSEQFRDGKRYFDGLIVSECDELEQFLGGYKGTIQKIMKMCKEDGTNESAFGEFFEGLRDFESRAKIVELGLLDVALEYIPDEQKKLAFLKPDRR